MFIYARLQVLLELKPDSAILMEYCRHCIQAERSSEVNMPPFSLQTKTHQTTDKQASYQQTGSMLSNVSCF